MLLFNAFTYLCLKIVYCWNGQESESTLFLFAFPLESSTENGHTNRMGTDAVPCNDLHNSLYSVRVLCPSCTVVSHEIQFLIIYHLTTKNWKPLGS